MPESFDIGLMLAVMLLAGIAGGLLAGWVRVPRVVGYLAVGVLLNQLLSSWPRLATDGSAAPLTVLTDVALALILFMIGSVFEFKRVRVIWSSLWRMSLCEVGLTFLLTGGTCAIVCWIALDTTLAMSVAVGLLLGTAAVATAPAATYLVLRQYEAKGPTTDHLLGLIGLNNLVSIVCFNSVFLLCTWIGWVGEHGQPDGSIWLNLLSQSIGSLVLGGLLGMALSALHARVSPTETFLVFLAFLLLLTAADDRLQGAVGISYNPLLTFLAMGAGFSNLALSPQRFEQALMSLSAPIFLLFFVLAGYNLHIEQLSHLGWLGGAYIAMRTVGKIVGIRTAAHRFGPGLLVHTSAGIGLLCQAGVAIGLGAFLVQNWQHPLADKINTVILAAVVVSELIGPILVKYTVVRVGEVPVVALLRPGAMRPRQVRRGLMFLSALRRRLPGYRSEPRTDLTASHLMRTNVHILHDSADFDDVMHFIEVSRLNDFPVIDAQKRYVGMVSFQSIRDLMYSPALTNLVTAADLADMDILPVTPDMSGSRILELFHRHHLSALAVVDDAQTNHLIGIVEQRDVLRAMHESTEGS